MLIYYNRVSIVGDGDAYTIDRNNEISKMDTILRCYLQVTIQSEALAKKTPLIYKLCSQKKQKYYGHTVIIKWRIHI